MLLTSTMFADLEKPPHRSDMKADKKFDAVKFMRQRREEISKEVADMTFEEKRKHLDEHVKFRSDRTPDHSSRRPE